MNWKQKREILQSRLNDGLCIWRTFSDQYTRAGAHKVLRQLVEAEQTWVVGDLRFPGEGGILRAYTSAPELRFRRNQLLHDVLSYLIVIRLDYQFRIYDHVDKDVLPDFELFSEGRKRHVFGETCTGSETYAWLVKERFKEVYAHVTEPVVWVLLGLWSTGDKSRMNALRERAAGLQHLWFCTFDTLMERGRGTELVNCNGEKLVLSEALTD